jgi:hypothetical protein
MKTNFEVGDIVEWNTMIGTITSFKNRGYYRIEVKFGELGSVGFTVDCEYSVMVSGLPLLHLIKLYDTETT